MTRSGALPKDALNLICLALDSARQRGNEAIIAYRTHSDVEKLVSELVGAHGKVLIYAAYLLGHLAGLEQPMESAAPEAYALVMGKTYFLPLFETFHNHLRRMHEEYGHWSSVQVFDGIKDVAEELLRVAGISFERQADGKYWVDVPSTFETLPLVHSTHRVV